MPTSTIQFKTDSARWNAVANRNTRARAAFVYAVKTTKVFCRPGCASRRPARKNVIFFDEPAEALDAGFRPCKRCSPTTQNAPAAYAKNIESVCRLIESSTTPLSLDQLAKQANLSPSQFHLVFKQSTGVTPKQYEDSIRGKRMQERLQAGEPVTDAIYGAGYRSNSRFYDKAVQLLGMLPSTFAKGGPGETIFHTTIKCALGQVLIAVTPVGLCAILIGSNKESLLKDLHRRFHQATFETTPPQIHQWLEELVSQFDSAPTLPSLPLDIRGTAFRKRVWNALLKIPSGETRTYSEIAHAIGSPKATRAVGSAIGNNPIAIAIPCHRVIRTDGTLGGYHWGLQVKKKLLAKEEEESLELK